MNEQGDFLARLAALLDGAGIDWYLCGSIASTHHGVPRSTQDIDVLLQVDRASLERLVRAFGTERYYLSDAEAARLHGQPMNVIDFATGWKADLMFTRSRFHASELSRRRRVDVLGVTVWVQSAEDTVLSKLVWMKKSAGSERQSRDVEGILTVSGHALDYAYIESWIDELDIRDEWTKARKQ